MPTNVDVVPESTYTSHIDQNVRSLWLGLLTGPIIYALYFVVGYLLVETACQTNSLQAMVGGLPLVSVIILTLTLAATLILLLNGLTNYAAWRRRDRKGTDEPEGSLAFMALGGFLLSILFAFLIFATGIPVFVLPLCAWV